MDNKMTSRVLVFGHDVKNSLTVIRIKIELLQKTVGDNSETNVALEAVNKKVDDIVSEVDRLIRDVKKADSPE